MTEYTNFIWDEPDTNQDLSERKCKITIDGVTWSNVYINDNSDINRRAKEWYFLGNIPEEYITPVAPIPTITRKQMRLWLLSNNITSAMVLGAIDQIPDPIQKEAAMIDWEDSQIYVHDHPLVIQMATIFGIPLENLPQAFRDASVL